MYSLRLSLFWKNMFYFAKLKVNIIIGEHLLEEFLAFISQICPRFSRTTRPENSSLVPAPSIQELLSSLVLSHFKCARECRLLDQSHKQLLFFDGLLGFNCIWHLKWCIIFCVLLSQYTQPSIYNLHVADAKRTQPYFIGPSSIGPIM